MEKKTNYRAHFHLMPPSGWMNDPNGSCFYGGYYHIFFQYTPKDPRGGLKSWGHYRSENLLDWEYVGIAIAPDSDLDKDGAYSGCGFTGDGEMELIYTGNVKLDGDYDYIYDGRVANILSVSSKDGENFTPKKLLLSPKDYPQGYTCHVRDPLMWKSESGYHMILGARRGQKDGGEHRGAILMYASLDKENWSFEKDLTTREPFGFMWECPDYFVLDGQPILSACPQGVPGEKERFQNHDQSGYFVLENTIDKIKEIDVNSFHEWDMGFDFYAPQTFLTPDGRRMLIGWVGFPQAEYTNEATIKEGWQHCLTIPRQLTFREGKIFQNPFDELLHKRAEEYLPSKDTLIIPQMCFDAQFTIDTELSRDKVQSKRVIQIGEDISIEYEDGLLSLRFINLSGEGRHVRYARVENLRNLRMLMDKSVLELYINDGEVVFTSAYYPASRHFCQIQLSNQIKDARAYRIV